MRHCVKDNTTKTAEKSIKFTNEQHLFTSYFAQKQADTLTRPMEPSSSNGFGSNTYWNRPTSGSRSHRPSRSLSPHNRESYSISRPVINLALQMSTLRFKHSKHRLPLTFNARLVSLLLHEQTRLNAPCETCKKNWIKRMTKLWLS